MQLVNPEFVLRLIDDLSLVHQNANTLKMTMLACWCWANLTFDL